MNQSVNISLQPIPLLVLGLKRVFGILQLVVHILVVKLNIGKLLVIFSQHFLFEVQLALQGVNRGLQLLNLQVHVSFPLALAVEVTKHIFFIFLVLVQMSLLCI